MKDLETGCFLEVNDKSMRQLGGQKFLERTAYGAVPNLEIGRAAAVEIHQFDAVPTLLEQGHTVFGLIAVIAVIVHNQFIINI